MVFVFDLWLPILVSAVFVFIASSVIHMAIPLHKSDYKRLPNEDKALDSLRQHGLQPGQYMFPSASSMKEMGSPEMIAKMNQGPVGYMILLPNGPFRIGRSLGQWFVLSIVISFFVAYVAGLGLEPGAETTLVFRMTSSVALLGYGVSAATDSIWKGVSWGVTARFLFDGLVYGIATAAAFAWLWPEAAA